MRRITIDEVRAACEKTGYRLAQGVTLNPEKRCGCPIGVLAEASGVRRPSGLLPDHGIGIDDDYAGGVMNGFDDYSPSMVATERYRIGHADGTAIRLALLPSS